MEDDFSFQTKAVHVLIDCMSDEQRSQLNGLLHHAYAGEVLASSNTIQFSANGAGSYAYITVQGDDWDVVAHLRALQRCSQQIKDLVIKITFEEGNEVFSLSDGKFEDDFIENCLLSHPVGKRPLLEGLFEEFEASITGTTQDLESGIKAFEAELERWEWPEGVPFNLARTESGAVVRSSVQGRVIEIRRVLHFLWQSFYASNLSPLSIQVRLTGKEIFSATIHDVRDYAEIDAFFQAGSRVTPHQA